MAGPSTAEIMIYNDDDHVIINVESAKRLRCVSQALQSCQNRSAVSGVAEGNTAIQTFTFYRFYIHAVTGKIDTISAWRSAYESGGLESWHGKSAEEFDAEKWIKDGRLKVIDLVSDNEPRRSGRIFLDWFPEAPGQAYCSEWVCHALDAKQESYAIHWRFPAVFGKEPEDHAWPWDVESFIYSVKVYDPSAKPEFLTVPPSRFGREFC